MQGVGVQARVGAASRLAVSRVSCRSVVPNVSSTRGEAVMAAVAPAATAKVPLEPFQIQPSPKA